ncbi:hypothetical protein O0L34_g14303 [Tuta absoluta]|nr:hypothetical protein O0L34_g14303 [Tuta absoluta]
MGLKAPVTTILLLVLCSVRAIRVPIDWNSDSAVTTEQYSDDVETVSESNIPLSNSPVPIPEEYFQYPANKPQFAVDVAKFHGVRNPEKHYSAHPVRPFTGVEKPVLGKHKILDGNNPIYHQFQQFTKLNDGGESLYNPNSAEYEVFHPYQAEKPALQEIYKDPVLDKIRNDIYNSQTRLQNYEKDAGRPDIQDSEYLESPEETDRKNFSNKYVPATYEIHRPQRRPIYYRPSPYSSRDHYLNRRFKLPLNQYSAKIKPVHYRPLRGHLQRLRQNHAIKYDDEHNEYPQIPAYEPILETPDGYDIYERGKAKYVALRNNVDESLNNVVKQNRPATYQRLELENNRGEPYAQMNDEEKEEEEFIPIKNYAQVRKFETTKHVPKSKAFEDAENFDEIKNAPRLREAIKSTKAQTVYTEEGYEDAAYDHEGEEKHAAENEAHGGHLSEKEISGGKYKIPSVNQKYEDAGGYEHQDQNLNGQKWKNNDKDKEEKSENEDYSEDETAYAIEAEVYDDVTGRRDKRHNEDQKNSYECIEDHYEEKAVERKKRENKLENNISNKENNETHEETSTNKEIDFKVPQLDYNSTYLTSAEILKKETLKGPPKKTNMKEKYPYYFKDLRNIHKDSPLRYAENLKFIPKKSRGGTEFYESRSKFLECPEVDDDVDPIPEKIKKSGHPNENDEAQDDDSQSKSNKADFSQIKQNRRLRGLGDKIDCFKAKFFGENPLDSPFFKEDIISNPEPVTAPNLSIYKLKSEESLNLPSSLSNVFNVSGKLIEVNPDVANVLQKFSEEHKSLQEKLAQTRQKLRSPLLPQNVTLHNISPQLSYESNIYSDVLRNMFNLQQPINKNVELANLPLTTPTTEQASTYNSTYVSYISKEDVTATPALVRRKRTATFVYEPYKIIREGQLPDSKKTSTTGNVSPLIKQLQASNVVDKVTKTLEGQNHPVKRNVVARAYKDIGRKDRIQIEDKGAKDSIETKFVDVSIDPRRREPRYEVKLMNHKIQYSPVENKKAMSLEDYKYQTNKTRRARIRNEKYTTSTIHPQTRSSSQQKSTSRPYFDVSQFLPKTINSDIQKPSASNTVQKVILNPTSTDRAITQQETKQNSEEDEYEEYDDDEITTTTSTSAPLFRKKRRKTTTTSTSKPDNEEEFELPKLRLRTRFNTTPILSSTTAKTTTAQYDDSIVPKFREKKKKSSKSTLVKDTKTYNDGDEDMMKDEVDALIGVQHDMEDYKPLYEKEIEKNAKEARDSARSTEDYDTTADSNEDDEEDDDTDEDDNISDSNEDEDENEENDASISETRPRVTTPKPTQQSLFKTTEAPASTTESRSAKLEIRPVVHKKKIEIHTEIPANKSLPNATKYRQDYKEVEIIKEMPSKPKTYHRTPARKAQKNLEALELYKDEKLAEEVNRLGAVEVFKENLDLVKGPKHGGNYRSFDLNQTSATPYHKRNQKARTDVEASQTNNEKHIELVDVLPALRTNSRHSNSKSRNNGRSAKLELLENFDQIKQILHDGNIKAKQDIQNPPKNSKNAKLIELDEEENNDEDAEERDERHHDHDSSRSRGRPLHGGNYRSAKLILGNNNEDETAIIKAKASRNSNRSKPADILSTFAQAVPHLTTTPAYILDPSKRMYYYVDDKR